MFGFLFAHLDGFMKDFLLLLGDYRRRRLLGLDARFLRLDRFGAAKQVAHDEAFAHLGQAIGGVLDLEIVTDGDQFVVGAIEAVQAYGELAQVLADLDRAGDKGVRFDGFFAPGEAIFASEEPVASVLAEVRAAGNRAGDRTGVLDDADGRARVVGENQRQFETPGGQEVQRPDVIGKRLAFAGDQELQHANVLVVSLRILKVLNEYGRLPQQASLQRFLSVT